MENVLVIKKKKKKQHTRAHNPLLLHTVGLLRAPVDVNMHQTLGT